MNLPLDLVPLLGPLPQLARATPELWGALAPRRETWAGVTSAPAELFDVCPELERRMIRPRAFVMKSGLLMPGGDMALLIDMDGTAMLRKTSEPAPPHHCMTRNYAVSPDGQFLARWFHNSMTIVGKRGEKFEADKAIVSAVFDEDNRLVYSQVGGPTMFKRRGCAPIERFHLEAVKLSAAGSTVLAELTDGSLRLTRTDYIGTWWPRRANFPRIAASCLDASGDYLAIAWEPWAVCIYDTRTMEQCAEYEVVRSPGSPALALALLDHTTVAVVEWCAVTIITPLGRQRFPFRDGGSPTFDSEGRLWLLQACDEGMRLHSVLP